MEQIRQRLTIENCIKHVDDFYLAVLGVYIFIGTMNLTTFEIEFPYSILWMIRVLLIVILAIKFGVNRVQRNQDFYLALAFLTLSVIVWANTSYDQLLDLALLVVGAYGIDYRKVLKVCFWVEVYVTVCATYGSLIGINENILSTIARGDQSYFSHAFGSIYRTDFVARLFYLLVMGWILYGREYWWILSALNIGAIYVAYRYCYARNGMVMLSLCLVVMLWTLVTQRLAKYRVVRAIERFMLLGIPVRTAGSIYLTSIYDEKVEWMAKINELITDRWFKGYRGMIDIPTNMFGNYFTMRGSVLTEVASNGLFIDNSYVLIYLQYGILWTVLAICLFFFLGWKMVNKKQRMAFYGFLLFVLHSIMEQHLMEVVYNGLLLAFFVRFRRRSSNKGIRLGSDALLRYFQPEYFC